jgi:predicted secreted hydrolase
VDGSEVLEVFVQVSGAALHDRIYMSSVWTSYVYAVDGTPNTVSEGAALTLTVIHQTNSTMVMLAYVSGDGYLAVQSRGTSNGMTTRFDAFSIPLKARQSTYDVTSA